ncbi:hypothetical protein WJX84_002694 [Apatococcus fuscideae]|uniref:Uncharacterized protein n=1 Tax=Apatococcus fuscideae TaxID=2026836 RepID=A0AAW1TJZ2_9CHLO
MSFVMVSSSSLVCKVHQRPAAAQRRVCVCAERFEQVSPLRKSATIALAAAAAMVLTSSGPAVAAGGTGMTSGKGYPDAARETSDRFGESATGPAQEATDATRKSLGGSPPPSPSGLDEAVSKITESNPGKQIKENTGGGLFSAINKAALTDNSPSVLQKK